MKQPKVFLTAAIALLLVLTIVTGCAFSGVATRPTTDPSDSTQPTTTPSTTAPSDPTTVPTQPTTLPPTTDGNELDLEPFNSLFSNASADRERNGFYAATTHTFPAFDTLSLKYYFELGYPDEPEVTKAELDELAKIAPAGLQNYVCKRLPKDKVAAELESVFGVSLENLRKGNLQGLYYLESTDCYYCFQTKPASESGFASALTAVRDDDGTVSLYYTDGKQTDGEQNKYLITLKPNGDSYRVISNVRIHPQELPLSTEPYPLADIPVISQTATLPANPTVEDLLLEPYTGSTLWYDAYDNEFDIDIELPLLVPFCDGAKAINEEIRNDFQWKIENINLNYVGRYGEFEKTISYEAYLNGDVLSIIIASDGNLDYIYYRTYNLDISTGKQLSMYDMIQRFAGGSYPEFLMHATYTINDYMSRTNGCLDDFAHDATAMRGYELGLSADGKLILFSSTTGIYMRTVVIPYDPAAHGTEFSGGEKDAYQWLFTRKPYHEYAETFAEVFANSFFLDPNAFLKYLSLQDDALIQEIAANTVSGVPETGIDQFKTLCNQCLSNNTTAKAAKVLLDALEKRP